MILGAETPIAEIGRDTCRDLLAVLQRLPSNARKRFPALSPREAAEHAATNGIAPMSLANTNEYMNKLSTLLNWALREEWVTRNPASGIRVAVSAKDSDRRRPFSTRQLVRIFNAPLYRGCRDDANGYATAGDAHPRRARFWIPLIGLFGGMRLNEICQMHTEDLRQVDGVWCFDIRADPKAGKQLKTAASQRLVPVHPTLKDIGLLAYYRDRCETGDLRFFPEIETDAFGLYSGRVSRWFSRFLSTCGADAERTCYHSFRHTFRDALREAGVEREIALRLGGWTDSGLGANAVGDGYGRGYGYTNEIGAMLAHK
jgi:integrase